MLSSAAAATAEGMVLQIDTDPTAAVATSTVGGMAVALDPASMQQYMAVMQQQQQLVAQEGLAGHKRTREESEQDDLSKRQRAEDGAAGVATEAANGAVDPGAAAAAAAAAAQMAATSTGMAAQLFTIGADGQPVLQVVPLQVPDAGHLGQLGQIDLSSLAQLDPATLQALNLQAMQVRGRADRAACVRWPVAALPAELVLFTS
jgi:hypothetical protein